MREQAKNEGIVEEDVRALNKRDWLDLRLRSKVGPWWCGSPVPHGCLGGMGTKTGGYGLVGGRSRG